MIPIYDEKNEKLYMVHKRSQHFPPHLHETPEFVYVTSGTLALGMNEELFPMEQGDFAIVFPNMIHHYQVFSSGENSAFYVYPPLSLLGATSAELQKYHPVNPVIPKGKLHVEIQHALQNLDCEEKINPVLQQAYIQIILARCLPFLELKDRDGMECGDLIYQTVSYIAGHFKEDLSLGALAKALGVNKFQLSRMFSATFHKNFNQYLNEHRLHYVCTQLEDSNDSITNICLDAGFQSQRTFNRVFHEIYRMTPREYRNRYKERYLIK